MSQNTLFNFIKRHVDSPALVSIPDCKNIQLDINKDGQAYYRLELPVHFAVALSNGHEEYHLLNHHISIYGTEKKNNPYLSQYHYTAYFIDEESAIHELHVYFDENDELTTEPVFSINTNDSFKPVEAKSLEGSFIGLAISNTVILDD